MELSILWGARFLQTMCVCAVHVFTITYSYMMCAVYAALEFQSARQFRGGEEGSRLICAMVCWCGICSIENGLRIKRQKALWMEVVIGRRNGFWLTETPHWIVRWVRARECAVLWSSCNRTMSNILRFQSIFHSSFRGRRTRPFDMSTYVDICYTATDPYMVSGCVLYWHLSVECDTPSTHLDLNQLQRRTLENSQLVESERNSAVCLWSCAHSKLNSAMNLKSSFELWPYIYWALGFMRYFMD